MTYTVSHWALDQQTGKPPTCTGTLTEFARNDHWILCTCDKCRMEYGVSLKHGEPSIDRGYDPDARTQSQREEAPF